MGSTSQRDLTCNTAARDFKKALAQARQIDSPWFCCQALAWVARFAPEAELVKVAEEAISAAFLSDDPYCIVGASAWPVRALIERGQKQKVLRLLPRLLEASGNIANPVSKLDALYLLWQAVRPAGGAVQKTVLDRLVTACLSANSWKAGRTMREILLVVALDNPDEAKKLIEEMPEGVYQRQAQRRIAEGQRGYIRPFFW